MGQVTIYLKNDLESKIKNMANSLNVSISKFISDMLEQKTGLEWRSDTKELAGSWGGFPSLEEIRSDEGGLDIKREEF